MVACLERAVPFPRPSPVDYVHARWNFEHLLSLSGPFVEWHMSRLRFSPRLMAVCTQLRISSVSERCSASTLHA